MEESAGVAARVRPLPPKNISLSAKARPLAADCNYIPSDDEESQPLLPNQAFEAALLWKAMHAAQTPRKCAEPGCTTKQRVLDGVKDGMQRLFCSKHNNITTSCARDRPLPRCGRRQTRASRSPQCQATDAGGTTDEEILKNVRLRDEFCGNLSKYKHALTAESHRRQAADAAHAEKAARLGAAGRCTEPGCTKPQAFGLKDSNTTEFCRDHRKDGMVNLCNVKRCRHNRCTRKPSFGVPGTRIVEFCYYHKKEGMANETIRRCTYSGCITAASHGFRTGTTHAEVCSQHARAGMRNVMSGRPNKPGERHTDTDLQCALTGASSNGSKKRARRLGILQRTSPIQADATVKKEIEDSGTRTAEARKVNDE